MNPDDVSDFLSDFRQTFDPPDTPAAKPEPHDDGSISAVKPISGDPAAFWIPSQRYARDEQKMLAALLARWENAVPNRPIKTVADGKLSITEYSDFCRKNNLGLFRRKTFLPIVMGCL